MRRIDNNNISRKPVKELRLTIPHSRFIRIYDNVYIGAFEPLELRHLKELGYIEKIDLRKNEFNSSISNSFYIFIDYEPDAEDFLEKISCELNLFHIDKMIFNWIEPKTYNNQDFEATIFIDYRRRRPCLCCKNLLTANCPLSMASITRRLGLYYTSNVNPSSNLEQIVEFGYAYLEDQIRCPGNKFGEDTLCFTITQPYFRTC